MKETLGIQDESKFQNEEEEEEPLLLSVEADVNYNTIQQEPEQHQESSESTRSLLHSILTPQVLAITVLYSIVAFQMLYFDGKHQDKIIVSCLIIFNT